MIPLIVSYLKFLFRSSNQHGVHSPFVYELVTKCFYDKAHHKAYDQLETVRNLFLKDHTTLEVTDFGAGSRVFSSNIRKWSFFKRPSRFGWLFHRRRHSLWSLRWMLRIVKTMSQQRLPMMMRPSIDWCFGRQWTGTGFDRDGWWWSNWWWVLQSQRFDTVHAFCGTQFHHDL